MTKLQKEVRRLIFQTDCTASYEEKTGHLNINYDGSELLSLRADGFIYFDKHNIIREQRNNKFFEIKNLIDSVTKYIRLYEQAPQMEAQNVKEYRRLATYNGIVMAGMEDDRFGFKFTTWNESLDRKFVSDGDYSQNFGYVEEVFATRSGLVNQERLFNDQQLSLLNYCLNFTIGNDQNLTYEQERDISDLIDQITRLLPPDSIEEETEDSLQQDL